MSRPFDDVDRGILYLLQRDARNTTAEEVGETVAYMDHPQVDALIDRFTELVPDGDEGKRSTEGHDGM